MIIQAIQNKQINITHNKEA